MEEGIVGVRLKEGTAGALERDLVRDTPFLPLGATGEEATTDPPPPKTLSAMNESSSRCFPPRPSSDIFLLGGGALSEEEGVKVSLVVKGLVKAMAWVVRETEAGAGMV